MEAGAVAEALVAGQVGQQAHLLGAEELPTCAKVKTEHETPKRPGPDMQHAAPKRESLRSDKKLPE